MQTLLVLLALARGIPKCQGAEDAKVNELDLQVVLEETEVPQGLRQPQKLDSNQQQAKPRNKGKLAQRAATPQGHRFLDDLDTPVRRVFCDRERAQFWQTFIATMCTSLCELTCTTQIEKSDSFN